MAYSLNRAQLIGNLGRDPENRVTSNNLNITSFSIATTNSYKGTDGNWINETTWHNIVAFNISDYLKQTLRKGLKAYVEGRISKREYTDKEGVKRTSLEIIASQIIPLDSRESSAGDNKEASTQDQAASYETNVENNEDLPF
ncbi:MAG: single-stranded DNA-binding protein [Chlorobiaceae bacterium]|nr:single-stranded DNA-binding protein [Chlorobiaceae bacterium]MBA4308728.1 single-stranded DNA-binding protein [Chlorobiaceae bacterium]